MYTPSNHIIDNNEVVLHEELSKIIQDPEQDGTLDVATGFFNLGGFALLKDDLKNINHFRLLLGKEPDLNHPSGHDVADDLTHAIQMEFEKEDFKKETHDTGEELIGFLENDKVEVRLFTESFLHGKAYIFPNLAIVGSSNFTFSGLGGQNEQGALNTELNTVDQPGVMYLREQWFEHLWDHESSVDFKDGLIDLVKNSLGFSTTPFEVYLKALYELEKYALDYRLDGEAEEDSRVELTKFQEDGVKRALSRIDRYGGVIVADSVGLGKTWIAKKVIERRGVFEREGFIVVSPASLREMWKREMKQLGVAEYLITQEKLSDDQITIKELLRQEVGRHPSEIKTVIIDESHNFRSPTSNRYERMFTLLEQLTTGDDPPEVLMLTATPINNSIWDLYYQLNLLTRGDNTAFSKDGIPNLAELFREADSEAEESSSADKLQPLLNQVMVRRTRQYIRSDYPEATIQGKQVKFPKRILKRLDYELDPTYQGLYEEISNIIETDLNMAYYELEDYKVGEKDELELGRMRALSGIFRTILLKRLESSVEAFRKSVTSQIEFLQIFRRIFEEENKILRKKAFHRYLDSLEDPETDPINLSEEAEEALEEFDPDEYQVAEFFTRLDEDIETFKEMKQMVRPISPEKDAKLQAFKKHLLELSRKGKIVVFSYYTDTLKYVYENLTNDEEFMEELNRNTDMLHGGHSTRKRQRVVERFAPKANREEGAEPLPEDEQIDIIFSTDVLSEGQNLQDANILINFDLHWNPTRMIQRAGRIDRLGSEFDEIEIYNFFPEDELEDLLRLVRRLQTKIEDINESVGLDASVLGETIKPKVFGSIKIMADGSDEEKQSLQDDLEEEQFGGGENFWKPLKEFIEQEALDKLRSIPDKARSGYKHGRIRGVFFGFTYEMNDESQNHHYWYFYDVNNDEWETSKHRIRQIIACDEEEPRHIDEDIDVYDLYDEASEQIREEFMTRDVLDIDRDKFIRDMLDELEVIREEYEFQFDEETVDKISRVIETLQWMRLTKKRKKDLRLVFRKYQKHQLTERQFIDDLEDFTRDKKVLKLSETEPFEDKRLKLKAVDVIS